MKPLYLKSWALVIGINSYAYAPKLSCACSDAKAIADLLTTRFGFAATNVTLLLDDKATRAEIMNSFWRFSQVEISEDDRIIVFFAGHGYTQTGRRGEIGFLVPQDGDCGNLSTLIRWDELTRNAELLPAKHVLFLMDACYGGLAITRALAPGTSRYLRDMLLRYSRQVLTSGKADEVVADANGGRPGHSLFTAHLLDALEGEASTEDGIISANGMMAYVADRVARDPYSKQSPHFGFLEGDGDFIFNPPAFEPEEETTKDVLIHIPAVGSAQTNLNATSTLVNELKIALSDPTQRIILDDLVNTEIRSAVFGIREESFPLDSSNPRAEFAERLEKYESALSRLLDVTILVSRWATADHQAILGKIVARIADPITMAGGNSAWLALRWYPINLLMYQGGIAALSAHNYGSLASLFLTQLGESATGKGTQPVILSTVDEMLEIDRYELFKQIPGYDQKYVPRSEYLLKVLQPKLEDLLFLGNSYEELFDRYEVLQALVYADLNEQRYGDVWGPFGRFAWKVRSRRVRDNPFEKVVAEVEQRLPNSPALIAGFFGGTIARFREITAKFRERMSQLPWY